MARALENSFWVLLWTEAFAVLDNKRCSVRRVSPYALFYCEGRSVCRFSSCALFYCEGYSVCRVPPCALFYYEGCSECSVSSCALFHCEGWSVRGGTNKSLAQPGRKQATVTKLGICSTHSPRSSIHFLARCSNFCMPIKKKNSEGCPSNQVYGAAMICASDEKWRPFICFFSPGNRW